MRFILPMLLLPGAAFAQTILPVVVPPSVDFTAIAVAAVGTVITVVGAAAVAFINARMKDATSAAALSNAVTNSLGAVKQALDANLRSHPLQVSLPGVTPAVAAGAQYVLDNAGDEAARFGITPADIVAKIDAKIGLQKLAVAPVASAPPLHIVAPEATL